MNKRMLIWALVHASLIALALFGIQYLLRLGFAGPSAVSSYLPIATLVVPVIGFTLVALRHRTTCRMSVLLAAGIFATGLACWQLFFAAQSAGGGDAQLGLSEAVIVLSILVAIAVQAALGLGIAVAIHYVGARRKP